MTDTVLELTDEQRMGVSAAVDLMRGRSTLVLTGAGVSTDSGIPDYRGAGAPVRNPMTFQQYLADDRYRRRYWAGSHLGWRRFAQAGPNAGHRLLAELEASGAVSGIVTQNVDGLHTRAGSTRVVPLHGSMDSVVCLHCGQFFARSDIAQRLTDANPWLTEDEAARLAPDGDADVTEIDAFIVPECTVCGGMLKPDVVFFGEFVPRERFREAQAMLTASDVLMVAGSSLVVNSGIRLVEQARRQRTPIIVVNRGITKGDGRAAVKIDAGTTEVLRSIADQLAV
ncbi:NAD-dependent protein deacetylase [Leifsonia sp. YIM 134122]|uniref:protein acetyllysine N-acetyltransferase n=1 Tax=Leifsonia stereocauli TaxID=3134136 RepID=A0ABU9W1Q4_9MICO